MAKTIDNMDFYVDIKPYQTGGSDQTFSSLRVSAGYRKGRGFYAGYHPGWGDGAMWGCLFDFSSNPLTAGITVDIEPATKNSSKRIGQMLESLKAAKEGIRVFFEQREFDCLRVFLKSVAKDGYLPEYEKQVVDYVQRVKRGSTEPTTEATTNNSNNQTISEDKVMMPKNQNESANVQNNAQVSNNTNESVEVAELSMDDIKPRVVKAAVQAAQGGKATTMPLGKHGTLVIAGVGGTKKTAGPAVQTDLQSGCGECKDLKSDERIARKVQDSVAPVMLPVKGSEYQVRAADGKEVTFGSVAPNIWVGETKSAPRLQYVTYEVKKTNKNTGKAYTVTGSKIVGFELTDPIYLAGPSFNGAIHTEQQDGKTVGVLRFSHKWTPAVKDICDLLNGGGGTIEDCVAIISGAKDARWQRIQERIAKNNERKARKAAREANADSTDKTDKPSAPAMDAMEQQMFELFKRFMQGDASAMQQVGAMVAKAA